MATTAVISDMPAASPSDVRSSGEAPRRTVLLLQLVTALASALTAAWVVVVLLTVGHSFADSDEGFYLLLYRWWDEVAPTFTGINFLYGPVFDLLGHNIVALRVFRLLTVLASHAAFGWAFMGWLRTRRPQAPATRWWEIAGTMILVASGGILYSWLPLSPGYNDVSTLGGLVAAAIVLRMIMLVELDARIPPWLPALLGPVAVAIVLAKWSSAVATFAVLAVVAVNAIRRRGWREVGRVGGWVTVGLLATFAVGQLLRAPLGAGLIEILRVNRQLARSGYDVGSLLLFYRDQVLAFGEVAITANAVLLIACCLATLAAPRYLRPAGIALAVVGAALSLRKLVVDGWYMGGGPQGSQYTIALIGILLAPIVVWVSAWYRDLLVHGRAETGSSLTRPRSRSLAVLVMVGLLPITQAAGSNTGLLGMAIDSLAAWVAVAIAVATGLEAGPPVARWLAAGAVAVTVAMTASIAVTGLWLYPYLSPGRAETTATVPGVPALSGIHLTPETAQQYADLYQALQPYTDPPGRAMMAFDRIAGVVLLLDGRPLGDAWTSTDPMRTAASMRAECLGPDRWWGERAPILLFNRPVTDVERETVRICGYDFDTDYRLLGPTERTGGLEVYVPVAG